MNKKIWIISLIFLLFLSLSAVSAADISDNDEFISADSPTGNFTDLANAISDAESELRLEIDYAYNYSEDKDYSNGIEVNKSNFLIDGQGHSISGDNFANIFIFNGNNITLKNITFTQSWAISDGGAVYINGSGEIENCIFQKNRADLNGGAVYFGGDAVVKNTTFIYNTANQKGGAVYVGGNLLVDNSNFYGGNALMAGAVYVNGTGLINASHFVLNTAGTDAGAVFFNKKGIIDNCNFSTNQAGSESQGGAIVFNDEGSVNNTNFIFNIVEGNAGAIEFKQNGTVENSVFTRNMAGKSTAAILFRQSGSLKNSTFINNTAKAGNGAVSFEGDASVESCDFEYNSGVTSGALYFNGAALVNNSIFTNNSLSQSYGAAIAGYNSKLTIANSLFLDNKAKSGFILYMNNYTFRFTGNEVWIHAVNAGECNFSNVTYWNGTVINSDDVTPLSRSYPGIDLTVEVYDSNNNLADNVTLKTDADNLVHYNPFHLDDGDYTIKAYHIEDNYYYTSDSTERSFSLKRNSSSVKINISDDEEFIFEKCNITFTVENRTDVRVLITDEKGEACLDEITDNDYITFTSDAGTYNITVYNLGDENYTSSNDSKVFKIIKTDLTVIAGSNVTSVGVEGLVNFTVVVTNTGPFKATGIRISDVLPREFKYVDSGCNITGVSGVNKTIGVFEMINWNITDLDVNESVLVWIKAKAMENGTFKNVAMTKANESAGVLNSTNITVWPVVNWSIINEADLNNVTVGDLVNFTVTVCNNGPSNATEVGIASILSDAFEFIAASDGAEIDDLDTVSWDIGDLLKGESLSVWFQVKVKENGTFTNWAHVYSDESMMAISNSTTITVKNVSITAADLVKYYHGPERFTVNVTDDEGNPLANKTVEITINGVTYKRTSDENGTAGLNINLNSGIYPVTASLYGNTANATVTVLTTINATDITKVYGDGTTFDATFLDSEGNCLKNGTTVQFNVNGVFYEANVSGDNGLACLDINLAAGEYIITSINPANGEMTANSITFIKADSNISLKTYDINFTDADGVIAEVILPADATGNVSIAIGDNITVYDIESCEHSVIDNNTVLTIRNNGLNAAEYNISANYTGNDCYNSSSADGVFNVLKADSNISMKSYDINVDEVNATIANITLPQGATGNVTVNIDNQSIILEANETLLIENTGLKAGEYIIEAVYDGDDNYSPSSVNGTVIISKLSFDANITLNDTLLTVEVPDDATGNVSLIIANETLVSPIENGTAAFDLSEVASGDYNATVIYDGDDLYNGFEVVYPICIEDKFVLTVNDLTKYYGGLERFYVNITDRDANPIANASITINLNGVNYTRISDENGTASMAVNLNSGEYPVAVIYNNTSVNATITVLATVNGTDVVKVFRNATQYYATFLDSEGNYLANGTEVTFNINGVMYKRYINGSEGKARLNINLPQGEYVITAINPVNGEMAANNITVLPSITNNEDLVKYYKNDSQYYVTIMGDDGNPVGENVTVKFNINGVFYERQTNASGVARLNINLEPGEYIITAEYNDCRVSNNITVLPVLTASDLTKTYGTPDPFVATLVDGEGKALGNEKIEFNINGVFYYRTTNSTGQAALNINLMPGVYIITSSYNGANIANTVTVKS